MSIDMTQTRVGSLNSFADNTDQAALTLPVFGMRAEKSSPLVGITG